MKIGILLLPYFTTPYRAISFNRGQSMTNCFGFRFKVSHKPTEGSTGMRSKSWEMGI